MHERSVVRALFSHVSDLLAARGACRVISIRVRLGAFAGVEPVLFRLAFENMRQSSPFRDTTLNMETVDLEARCRDCGREFRVQSFEFVCPHCGGGKTDVIRGEDVTLESVTIEDN